MAENTKNPTTPTNTDAQAAERIAKKITDETLGAVSGENVKGAVVKGIQGYSAVNPIVGTITKQTNAVGAIEQGYEKTGLGKWVDQAGDFLKEKARPVVAWVAHIVVPPYAHFVKNVVPQQLQGIMPFHEEIIAARPPAATDTQAQKPVGTETPSLRPMSDIQIEPPLATPALATAPTTQRTIRG